MVKSAWQPTILSLAMLGVFACGSDAGGGKSGEPDAGDELAGPLAFSGEFTMGETIPSRHKCPMAVVTGGLGDNISPALAWQGEPEGTQSFAVVLYDTRYDAFHWAVWDIPATVHELPEGLEPGFELATPAGAKQVAGTGPDAHAYFGPCSDAGPFAGTYEYRLYALSKASLELEEDATYAELEAALTDAELESVAWEGTPE